ncbi:MAG: hypothetical protein IJX99_05610 [Clostridia bacterium]|nr:hypothetical protein [Clostridia bacterium]
MTDVKTTNSNGLCYKELDNLKIGDVFSYISEKGVLRHYVISFLHKRMGHSIATIIYPDGFSETITIENLKNNKDKYEENLENWSLIYSKYINEAKMYE